MTHHHKQSLGEEDGEVTFWSPRTLSHYSTYDPSRGESQEVSFFTIFSDMSITSQFSEKLSYGRALLRRAITYTVFEHEARYSAYFTLNSVLYNVIESFFFFSNLPHVCLKKNE